MTGAWTASEVPVIGAPMAGGATKPALVAAVASAGGLGFLAGGYKTPEALGAEMAELGGAGVPFGVNLFVPGPSTLTEAEFRRYAEELADEGAPYGLELAGAPMVVDDDHWQGKIDLLLAHPVPFVSFTFGLPGADVVSALAAPGMQVLATVTTLGEARAAVELGVHGLIAQGTEAGGHSGTHTPEQPEGKPLRELVQQVVAETSLPVIAAGGVSESSQVRELLASGAAAVAVGTVLLRTDESGASAVHKEAIATAGSDATVITRAFTGRPARGLRNGFIERHEAGAPNGYPAIHHLTRPLRAAAAAAGQPDQVHLWAGTGYGRARTGPAADVITALAADL
ncbi:nitronate monooxygenase [Kribbella italica]|uniref:Propionate 3-nitronate monooxygenase n=1 Tax=Kribbella italica TaxID=1540520 RepID=A0A7W9J799_9ACTN|nr:nitronate monooxygenase [Kribbella italica]MBB5836936.1 NAD(P)H-dependent flavin oxidoreductase YrpB (nitropropane dioxygenase family) [Kribbella italica]